MPVTARQIPHPMRLYTGVDVTLRPVLHCGARG